MLRGQVLCSRCRRLGEVALPAGDSTGEGRRIDVDGSCAHCHHDWCEVPNLSGRSRLMRRTQHPIQPAAVVWHPALCKQTSLHVSCGVEGEPSSIAWSTFAVAGG